MGEGKGTCAQILNRHQIVNRNDLIIPNIIQQYLNIYIPCLGRQITTARSYVQITVCLKESPSKYVAFCFRYSVSIDRPFIIYS